MVSCHSWRVVGWILRDETYVINDEETSIIADFSFSPDYFKTRQLAHELGETDNDWIYEDDPDWFAEEDIGNNFGYEDSDGEEEPKPEWEYWEEKQEATVPEFLKVDEGWEIINETDRISHMPY